MQNEFKKIIKYRAWDNLTKTMMSHEQVLRHFHGCYEIDLDPFQDEHLTHMQFTGYKDIAGNDIYEGDIVEGGGETFAILSVSSAIASNFLARYANAIKIVCNIFKN